MKRTVLHPLRHDAHQCRLYGVHPQIRERVGSLGVQRDDTNDAYGYAGKFMRLHGSFTRPHDSDEEIWPYREGRCIKVLIRPGRNHSMTTLTHRRAAMVVAVVTLAIAGAAAHPLYMSQDLAIQANGLTDDR